MSNHKISGRRQVAVLCNFDKPEAKSAYQSLVRWLKKNRVAVSSDWESPSLKRCELAVALGGDGTMLRAARLLAPLGVPILGVNLGRLGFLAETGLKNMADSVQKALKNELEVEDRTLLQISIYSGSNAARKPRLTFLALNDCYLHATSTNRIVEIEAHLNGRYLATYTGDGVIIATPTGSTAYSLAASGPIVSPRLPVMLITPICPHTLAQRPLVVSSEDSIELKMSDGGRSHFVHLSADGQRTVQIRRGDRVTVESAPLRARFLVQPGRSYYEVLRNKLKWAEQMTFRPVNHAR